MKEQDYQKKIIKFLESEGAYTVKVVSASKKGVPDIIACYKGRFIGIEVKTPSTKTNTTKLQEHNLKLIKGAKGYAYVCVEVKEVQQLLLNIDNEVN